MSNKLYRGKKVKCQGVTGFLFGSYVDTAVISHALIDLVTAPEYCFCYSIAANGL